MYAGDELYDDDVTSGLGLGRATLAGWWCPSCGHGNATRGQRSGCAGCDWRPLRGERSPAMVDLRRTASPPR